MESEVKKNLNREDTKRDSPEDSGTSDSSSDMRSSDDRGLWANKLQFFLAIMGYTVGLGSVWRFPIICSRNGGGAFLIPFFFFLVTSGGPLYYLEVCLGQFTGMSAGSAFEFCPLLKGIGLLQVVLSMTVLWYAMIVFAWVLYYLYSSMQSDLPWTTCHNEWNTKECKGCAKIGEDLHYVVYVTATAPYVVLTIIFIKGLTLDGAIDGIKTFLQPDWSKLFSAHVWVEAAIQVLFSLGPSWGGVITISSYNKFHEKSFWSSTVCVFSAGFTAFYNGLIAFALMGFMAKSSGVPIQDVASQSGPGLAFVVFPTVLSQMPLPQLWSVLFFIMLVTVVFDSLFGMFETVTSAFIDFFPHQLINHRSALNIVAGLCFFISELPLTMNGGIYLMQLGDWYFSQFALLACSALELIAVCWIYGTDRFANDIKMMTGRDVCVFLRIMWTIIIPSFVLSIFFAMLSQYSTPHYGDGYVYSSEAVAAGIFTGLVPIFVMIGVGILTFLQIDGSIWQRLKIGLTPSKHWIPHDQEAEQLYLEKPYTYPDTWWKRIFLNLRGSKNNPIF